MIENVYGTMLSAYDITTEQKRRVSRNAFLITVELTISSME